MTRRRPSRPHVALIIESSIEYGRGVLRGIAGYLREHGPWSIFLEQRELGAALPKWIREWDGDGIITRSDDPRIARSGLPTVGLYDRAEDRLRLPMILNDNLAVGRMGARHLADRGFRHLAYYGVRRERWSELRLAGAADVARAAKATFAVHASGGPWELSQERLKRWLVSLPRPLGLVAANDLHGLRALDACRRAGLAVPEELAVVGADDDAEVCELSDPPLSSVTFHPEKVGYEAAALLERLMAGRAAPSEPLLVPPLGVSARQSSDILAIDDPDVAKAIHHIRRHAFDGITVEDVLREVPLSRRALEHRFRRRLGRTPKEEIQRLRFEQAKSLLATTDLPVARISDRLGFHQPAYLSAAFQREAGLTPSAYRRNHRS
ncbi:MAG TPA: DNA-binding transcriptional regulator [Planctomycetota bacterium]|nr:DNA-binding transcriptional regulator [Planctomycetota bacterium]